MGKVVNDEKFQSTVLRSRSTRKYRQGILPDLAIRKMNSEVSHEVGGIVQGREAEHGRHVVTDPGDSLDAEVDVTKLGSQLCLCQALDNTEKSISQARAIKGF